jgi:hypothetical protein
MTDGLGIEKSCLFDEDFVFGYSHEKSAEKVESAQIFGKNSALKTEKRIEPQGKPAFIGNGLNWSITGFFMIYLLVVFLAKRYVSTSYLILFSSKNQNLTYQSLSRNYQKASNMLILFTIFVVFLFTFLFATDFGSNNSLNFSSFVIIAVVLYLVFKRIAISTIGYISENSMLKGKLFLIQAVIFSLYGIFSGFFLIMAFLLQKGNLKVWFTIVLIILVIMYLFKLFRIITIFKSEKISTFFLILYLCGVEMLPMWLIIDFL